MSSYQKFAEYYDILTANIPYEKRGEYFNSIINKNGIKSGILVDLACGTGSLSEVMAEIGFDVIGVDSSQEMLSVAMNKRYESGNDILYLCQTMQALDLYGTIDVCLCALDSLNHIISPKDVQIVFNKVSMFLNPNGLFIFDVNTTYKHQNILSNNTYVYDCDDVYCVWQNSCCKDNLIEISLDMFGKNSNNTYSKYTENFFERAYTHEQIISFIENSNLKLIDYYADDSFDKPKNDCQRIIYVAKSKK